MIAVLRSELYRAVSIRSSAVSIGVLALLGLVFGWFSADMWTLLAGFGSFGISVMATAQHYQHRTAVLVCLGEPRRLVALAGQAVAAAFVASAVVAVSGAAVLAPTGSPAQWRSTMAVVPLMAVFGVANAAVVRRSAWLLIGYAGWLIFVEGLIGKLEQPLPFSAFLAAGSGDRRDVVIFAGWTVVAMGVAVVAVRRDLAGD